MYYIGERDVQLDASEPSVVSSRIYEFCPVDEDYFTMLTVFWNEYNGTIYHFNIGDHLFKVPAGMYICVGCESGNIDWILSDELIDRGMTAILMTHEFKLDGFSEIRMIGYESGSMFVPSSKNPLPVTSEVGNHLILVSSVDQYHKYKNKDYVTFFVL